jgi:Ser/Thr protein kinase RdoA (MazF antagonist)
MGHVFRVRSQTGIWALKGYRRSSGIDGPGDLDLQEALMAAAAAAGVAFPQPCRTVDGGLLTEIRGARWKAFEWVDIDGTPSSRQVGELLARLHSVAWPSDRPVDRWYADRTMGGTWEDLATLARHQDWFHVLAPLIPELVAEDEIVACAFMPPASICHCDLNEANVVRDTRGRVLLLDWDNCGPLPLSREVGYVLADPFICPDPAEFIEAYRGLGGVFQPKGLDVFATAIAANNNYLGKLIIQSVGGDNWARSMLLPMLEHPLRIADLERLLELTRDSNG